MNHHSPIKLNVLVLYGAGRQDQQDAYSIQPFLEVFRRNYFEAIEYWKVERKNSSLMRRKLYQVDMVIVLASIDLMNGLEANKYFQEKLISLHLWKRLHIIGIKLNPFQANRTFWVQGLDYLPKDSFIHDPFWKTIAGAFNQLCKELKAVVEAQLDRQIRLHDAWEFAQMMDTRDEYFKFRKEFPYSKFYEQAKKREEVLTDACLWQIAREKHSIRAYYIYLKHSPVLSKLMDAAHAIVQLESKEEDFISDALDYQAMEFGYSYRNKFFKKHQEIEQLISKFWSDYQYDTPPSLHRITNEPQLWCIDVPIRIKRLKGNYIDYQAMIDLDEADHFAYHEIRINTRTLYFKLLGLKKKLEKHRFNLRYTFLSFYISVIIVAALLPFNPLSFILIGGWILRHSFCLFIALENEEKIVSEGINKMKFHLPIARIAFILRSYPEYQRILRSCFGNFGKIETEISKIEWRLNKWQCYITPPPIIELKWQKLKK